VISEDRKAGGRLQLRRAPEGAKEGPWRLVGTDRRGRRMKVYGSEATITWVLERAFETAPI